MIEGFDSCFMLWPTNVSTPSPNHAPSKNTKNKKASGGSQTRAASTIRISGVLCDQNAVSLARENGEEQLSAHTLLLVGQP